MAQRSDKNFSLLGKLRKSRESWFKFKGSAETTFASLSDFTSVITILIGLSLKKDDSTS
jgi:hypothetical protein